MTFDRAEMTTPIELTTMVEPGGRVSVRLAGREVDWGQCAPGRDPSVMQATPHSKALDALTQLLKDQLHPGLAEFRRKQQHGV